MPNRAHLRAAAFHENAARSHRTAAEHYANNDRAKGDEHAIQARAYSRSARDHSEQTQAKSAARTPTTGSPNSLRRANGS
jgi:hypothetical protein